PALAAADLSAFATSLAPCFGETSRYASASATFMPSTESATSRALRGVLRTNFCTAETSIVATISLLQRRRFFGVRAMAAEVASRRELAQPVTDHVLADEDRHMLAAVVDRDRVPDHVGVDHRRACPGADHLLVGALAQPAAAAGLAAGLVFVLDITDLTNRGLAADVDPSQFAAWHAHDRVIAFLGEELRARPGRSHQLPAPSQRQLDVMHGRADG